MKDMPNEVKVSVPVLFTWFLSLSPVLFFKFREVGCLTPVHFSETPVFKMLILQTVLAFVT